LGGNYNLNEIADRFAEKLDVLEEEEMAEQKKIMEANPNAFTIYEGNASDVSQKYLYSHSLVKLFLCKMIYI
jgi:hypothetical protein